MKKIIAMLLALLLMLTCCAAIAEGTEATETEETEERDPKYDELVVANPTVMRGEFFTEMWGNSTTDIDVRVLIHGYNLVTWENALAMFIPDSQVVERVATTNLANGNRQYTFTLKDDLFYCDGTQITAWDYAFSILFTISPEIIPTGGTPVHEDFLVGYEEYFNGEVDYYAGVRVLDDFTLRFEVVSDYVPFFYEYGLFYITPYPIYEIAPGYVPEGAYETDYNIASRNPDVTYFNHGENWFVQSGYNNDGEEIFYSKESMTDRGLKTFWITYPTAKREFGDKVTAEFEANFSF